MSVITTFPPRAAIHPRHLFKIRRHGPAWTCAVKAIRAIVTAARKTAPWRGGPSADQIAEVIYDNINRLGTQDRNVLAIVFVTLLAASDRNR